jgi:hypothetical protein
MIGGSIGGGDGLDGIIGRVQAAQRPPMDDLARAIQVALIEGNRRQVESGRDLQGRPLAPLAESTVRKRGHRDEPLRPGGRSPFVDGFEVDVRADGDDRITMLSRWIGHKAGLAKTGTAHQPPRDLFGISDQTRAEVRDEVQRFGRRLIGGDDSEGAGGRLIARF